MDEVISKLKMVDGMVLKWPSLHIIVGFSRFSFQKIQTNKQTEIPSHTQIYNSIFCWSNVSQFVITYEQWYVTHAIYSLSTMRHDARNCFVQTIFLIYDTSIKSYFTPFPTMFTIFHLIHPINDWNLFGIWKIRKNKNNHDIIFLMRILSKWWSAFAISTRAIVSTCSTQYSMYVTSHDISTWWVCCYCFDVILWTPYGFTTLDRIYLANISYVESIHDDDVGIV